MSRVICNMKSYIQPFERTLALKELHAISGVPPVPVNSLKENSLSYSVDTKFPMEFFLNRLTYWEKLNENSSLPKVTRQARREATVNLVRNGISPEALKKSLPFEEKIPLPCRRVLRYGSHGIHEYRGKFFPQLVRSILNIGGVDKDSIVLDTMCGSGTTLVEAALLGCKSIGMDINPLSVLMAQAKCDILLVDPNQLVSHFESLKKDILEMPKYNNGQMIWFKKLDSKSQGYLVRWFDEGVLNDLDIVASRISITKNEPCRKLFKLCLSNILRRISWQKTDDLRVRKDIRLDIDIDVFSEFIGELNRSVKLVLSFLFENQGIPVGNAKIIEGDARGADGVLSNMVGKIDIIVTSPPYATALPYLDTDRLTLCYLDLLARPEHRKRDLSMIGNREISNGYRKQYLEEWEQKKNQLPSDINQMINLISKLNRNTDAGFRRLNLPALLSRYFLDMQKVLKSFTVLLKKGAPAYVVVGNNHTIAGGHRVEIETNKLLAELGESVGLKIEETISMEMLVSRDIFKKNSGNSETIICFKNNQ